MESLSAETGSPDSASSLPSSPSKCPYEQLCDRLLRGDPALTKLVVDDLDDWPFMINNSSNNFFLSPEYGSFDQDGYDGSYVDGVTSNNNQTDSHISKIGKVFKTAADCVDQACTCGTCHERSPFYVQEIEVRYVDLSSPSIYRPLVRLLWSFSSSPSTKLPGNCCSCKSSTSRTWKAVRFIGCEAPAYVWNQLFWRGGETEDINDEVISSTSSLRCDELVLNHNRLPDELYLILGSSILHSNNTVKTFKIQRETITKSKARALLFGGDGGGIPLSTRFSRKNSLSSSSRWHEILSHESNGRRCLDTLAFNFCKFSDNETVQILGDFLRLQEQRQHCDHRCGRLNDDHHRHHSGGLQTLDLGACYLRDEQIAILIRSMSSTSSSRTSSIQNLVLTLNSCHDYSCYALAEWLSSRSCQLKSLQLSHQQRQSQPNNQHLSQSNTTTGTLVASAEAAQIPSTSLTVGHNNDNDDGDNGSESISSFGKHRCQYQNDGCGQPPKNKDSTEPQKSSSDRVNNSNNLYSPSICLARSCPCSLYLGRLRLDILANGLANNTSLKELDLSRNRLEFFDIIKLIDSISTASSTTRKGNCSLQVLNLTSNSFGIEGLRYIAASLPKLNGMKNLMLGNNDPDRIYSTDQPSTSSMAAANASSLLSDTRIFLCRKQQNHHLLSTSRSLLPSELLNGLMKNYTLEKLLITKTDWLPSEDNNKGGNALNTQPFSAGDYDIAMDDLRKLPYILALNFGGRGLLSCPSIETGLWPVILSRAMRRCDSYTMTPPASSTLPLSSSSPVVLSSAISDRTRSDEASSSLATVSAIDQKAKPAKPLPSPLGADVVYFLLRNGPVLVNQ